MKKLLVVLFVVFIPLTSCEKTELPDITEEGNNTFGMLVNGEVWTPHAPFSSALKLSVGYSPFFQQLHIGAYNSRRREKLAFYFSDIVGHGDYFFACGPLFPDMSVADENFNYCSTRFNKGTDEPYDPKNEFVLFNRNESNLNIIKLDTINKIISGTFSVNLHNFDGDVLEITNGRFDVKY